MANIADTTELSRRILLLEGKVAFLYNHLGVIFEPEAAAGDDAKVIEQIKKGNMMEAIKAYRESHDVSFPDAKQAVEDMIQRLGL